MIVPATVHAAYRRGLDIAGETIAVRRYSGTGVNRTYVDTSVMARVTGYSAAELVGGITQGDRRVILLAEDLANSGFSLPLLKTDTIVVRGKEMAMMDLDDSTRRIQGELIAYELRVRG